jgi:hypothetical protein
VLQQAEMVAPTAHLLASLQKGLPKLRNFRLEAWWGKIVYLAPDDLSLSMWHRRSLEVFARRLILNHFAEKLILTVHSARAAREA